MTFTVVPEAVRQGEVLELAVTWSPRPPRHLSRRERDAYYDTRNRFIAELVRLTGGRRAPAIDLDLERTKLIEPASQAELSQE